MQLLADIQGYHHLWCFRKDERSSVYIFNHQLQFYEKKEIGPRVKDAVDIRILTFKNYYFLYIHTAGSTTHEIWKIDGMGAMTSMTGAFGALIESEFKKTSSTLQLVREKEKLFIIGHTYYDAIKKIGSSVVELDENLGLVHTRKVFHSFNQEEESLRQVMLAGNDLFILKTSSSHEKGKALEIVKVDLNTGIGIRNSYNSASDAHMNPGLIRNAEDSSILLYSMIKGAVFISRLDYVLSEKTPVTILRSQFRNNTNSNFILLEGQPQHWVNMQIGVRQPRVARQTTTQTLYGQDFATQSGLYDNMGALHDNYVNSAMATPREYYTYRTKPASIEARAGVRFTLLDRQFKLIKDSVVINENKQFLNIQPSPFTQFRMHNNSYLVLIQNLTIKQKNLILVHTNDSGQLTTSDINVYNRYDYLLPQLQSVGNEYFILPYTYKNEIGLVRIELE